jgi:hypothetical protein
MSFNDRMFSRSTNSKKLEFANRLRPIRQYVLGKVLIDTIIVGIPSHRELLGKLRSAREAIRIDKSRSADAKPQLP